ncbi:unnamed protein product, partial [Mesorhabditis spiculigera]
MRKKLHVIPDWQCIKYTVRFNQRPNSIGMSKKSIPCIDLGHQFKLVYNAERGRCLGSHQRNEESVRRICRLMSLSTQLQERNAELAENAREKLRNECIKFTEYNKGATTVDLMMDWIWRPKGQRRSPWGLIDDFILHDNVNRVDFAVLHAYRFVRAFGERGVLPEIAHFQPVEHPK